MQHLQKGLSPSPWDPHLSLLFLALKRGSVFLIRPSVWKTLTGSWPYGTIIRMLVPRA